MKDPISGGCYVSVMARYMAVSGGCCVVALRRHVEGCRWSLRREGFEEDEGGKGGGRGGRGRRGRLGGRTGETRGEGVGL